MKCGMDLTDGLLEFGHEILEQSGYGVEFSPPLHLHEVVEVAAKQLGYPKEAFLFEPGYDTPFAHGWCISKPCLQNVQNILDGSGIPYSIVGTVSSEHKSVVFRSRNGRLIDLPRYWDDVCLHRGSIEEWEKQIVSIIR